MRWKFFSSSVVETFFFLGSSCCWVSFWESDKTSLLKNLRGSLRIFKGLWRSAKICKRSLKMRISVFQRSLKILKDPQRSWQDPWGSSKILATHFEDLSKIFIRILKDLHEDLWRSLTLSRPRGSPLTSKIV